MKKVLLCFFLGVMMLSGCSKAEPQPDVKVVLKDSTIFTEEEKQEAANIIIEEFNKDNWKGCTLNEITYQGDERSKEKANYYAHDLAQAFEVSFTTTKNCDASLNANSEYKNYQILLYKDDQNKWQIDYAGCGYG